MGNSEVGHMTIGAGRVLYQDLVKISLALENGDLEKNIALHEMLKKSDRVHIIGLLSDGWGSLTYRPYYRTWLKLLEQDGKQGIHYNPNYKHARTMSSTYHQSPKKLLLHKQLRKTLSTLPIIPNWPPNLLGTHAISLI